MEWKNIKDADADFKCGTLLKLKDGSVLIVGDINENLGYCDCCSESQIEYWTNEKVDELELLKSIWLSSNGS
jgi:hypothetical protein